MNVELFLVAADRVHIRHAGHVAELGPHGPVLNRAEVGRRVWPSVLVHRARLGLDGVEEDLAQAGRDRPHGRL